MRQLCFLKLHKESPTTRLYSWMNRSALCQGCEFNIDDSSGTFCCSAFVKYLNVILMNAILVNVIMMKAILMDVTLVNVILMNVILVNVILMNAILMNAVVHVAHQLL